MSIDHPQDLEQNQGEFHPKKKKQRSDPMW